MPVDRVLPHDLDDLYGEGAEQAEMADLREPVTSEYFATIRDGKILGIAQSIPPHTLLDCQVILTKEEYYLLDKIGSRIEKTAKMLRDIKAKVRANGS